MAGTDFTHRDLKLLGKTVFRLGLAANYGIDEAGVRSALDRGNYSRLCIRAGIAVASTRDRSDHMGSPLEYGAYDEGNFTTRYRAYCRRTRRMY